MSGLLDRLRGWLASVFGGGSSAGTERSADETPEPTHECAICGTETGASEGECPLCGSTDLQPIASGAAGEEVDGGRGDERSAERLAGDAPQTVRSADGDDEAVDRLRALRDDQE